MPQPTQIRSTLLALFLSSMLLSCGSGQKPDPSFDTHVARPANTDRHPRVFIDEAHRNFHTASGNYKPFAELLKSDGYAVLPSDEPFSRMGLRSCEVLVISNAMGDKQRYDPAFTGAECDEVVDWVKNGGSLLLIADHFPLGSAAEILSRRFGVGMSKGYTEDSVNYDHTSRDKGQLVFSLENGLLGEHPIIAGRDSTERVGRIVTFTGQSLEQPAGSAMLLRLGSTATDQIPDSMWETKDGFFSTKHYTRFSDPVPATGRAQGIALTFGTGRVVILGEAAMLTAQVAEDEHFGMQIPGNDNRQFALNIMHWLSRLQGMDRM